MPRNLPKSSGNHKSTENLDAAVTKLTGCASTSEKGVRPLEEKLQYQISNLFYGPLMTAERRQDAKLSKSKPEWPGDIGGPRVILSTDSESEGAGRARMAQMTPTTPTSN